MKKRILFLILSVLLSFLPLQAKEKFEVINDTAGIHVFKINTKKYGKKIKPYMTKKLTTPQVVYDDNCFDFVVNGGFFDVKNGKSVSYVTIDNEMVADVEDNVKLMKELKKQKRHENVLSRAELRILENKRHKLKFDIAMHNDPIKKGYKIKHALQAGPMLLPTMDLVQEGFVIKENDVIKSQSVDILKRRERTAIGLKGKYLYIVLFTKDHKVDAYEMKNYMEETLKVKKSMAFDGGLSTAVNYKNISIGSLGKYQRRVKSFLIVER
ncbi:MAG: phosphodiester glycosidase family protein [Candidatus Gastranaerophilales bacterium]|nr:phosphodiester glycosidase family protein [Candidatus Gastranaerophilales bacterium]